MDAQGAEGPLGRYATVLEAVAAFRGAATMTDLCGALGLPTTTVHRLLGGLVRARLVEGGGRGGRYRLGPRLHRLLHAAAEDGWVATLAREPLRALAAERRETCYLTRLVGHRVFVVARESPEPRWRHYVQPGYVMPPHAAAAAKMILAFQPAALVDQALAAETLPKLTPQTCTDPALVRAEYAAIRDRGYATCVSEIDEGFGALAVPVTMEDGAVLYGVGLTGPVERILDAGVPARLASLRMAAARLAASLARGAALMRRDEEDPGLLG